MKLKLLDAVARLPVISVQVDPKLVVRQTCEGLIKNTCGRFVTIFHRENLTNNVSYENKENYLVWLIRSYDNFSAIVRVNTQSPQINSAGPHCRHFI
jgi:hypothetical protein